jgi:hypothetical protein
VQSFPVDSKVYYTASYQLQWDPGRGFGLVFLDVYAFLGYKNSLLCRDSHCSLLSNLTRSFVGVIGGNTVNPILPGIPATKSRLEKSIRGMFSRLVSRMFSRTSTDNVAGAIMDAMGMSL